MVSLSVLVAFIMVFTASAQAEPIRAGGCPELVPHQADADVNYQDGVDAKGWAVAPADLNPSPLDPQSLKSPTIDLDIPLRGYVDESVTNLDTGLATIGMGQLQVDPSGETRLNGAPLSGNQAPLHPDCLRDK